MLGKTHTRQRAGHRARNNGETFEQMIIHRANYQSLSLIKIPDGCKKINSPRGLRLIPVQTPFDFVLFYQGYGITFDAKTTNESTFLYSQINRQQLFSLKKCAENALKSGYLIWFRENDLVSFITAKTLSSIQRRTSIGPQDGQIIGRGGGFSLKSLFDLKELTAHLINPDTQPIE